LQLKFDLFNKAAFYADGKIEDKPSQKLPFIGVKEFQFTDGNSNVMHLEIKKNGQAIIGNCAPPSLVARECFVSYKGKYKNPLPTGEKDGSKYLIHNNMIYLLKKTDEVETGCKGDGVPCVSELLDGE
jgi:hypothetical protein